MFPKQFMGLKTDLFAWAKSLMLLKSWAISTMKPHSEQETWFFRIVAGFSLREGIKLIEYKERAKNILPRHCFQCGTEEATLSKCRPFHILLRLQALGFLQFHCKTLSAYSDVPMATQKRQTE